MQVHADAAGREHRHDVMRPLSRPRSADARVEALRLLDAQMAADRATRGAAAGAH